jgi:acetyl-CoA carboxylase biotin carboxyl carrier protein
LNLKELKEILELLDEKEIAEFELEEEGIKLRIRKSAGAPPQVVATVGTPAGPPPQAASPTPPGPDAVATTPGPSADDDVAAGLFVVKSPIVGTFYRAPDPTAAPFVNVGDKVRVGQVLCIIEAMKLMNEIEAEVAGEIVKIRHESGQPVQYGEPLFVLRPES